MLINAVYKSLCMILLFRVRGHIDCLSESNMRAQHPEIPQSVTWVATSCVPAITGLGDGARARMAKEPNKIKPTLPSRERKH